MTTYTFIIMSIAYTQMGRTSSILEIKAFTLAFAIALANDNLPTGYMLNSVLVGNTLIETF